MIRRRSGVVGLAGSSGVLAILLLVGCSGSESDASGSTQAGGAGTQGGNGVAGGSSGSSNPSSGGTAGAAAGGRSAATGGASLSGTTTGGSESRGGSSTRDSSSFGGASSSFGGATASNAGGNTAAVGGKSSAGGASAGAGASATGGKSSAGGASTGGTSSGGGSSGGSVCGVTPSSASGVLQMENLCRGVVAVRTGSNNYVSWRMMGYEPDDITFNVYRNGTKVNATPIGANNGTNYTDVGAPANATYTVRAILNGVEQGDSANTRTGTSAVATLAQPYIEIPVQLPAIGDSPVSTPHAIGDGSIGDLDGDGEYEIVLKLEQSPQDNSISGATGQTHLQAYKLNGKRLWDINLGSNIREGAHYTQFVVYDFDGDGKSEVSVKTAPGTRDGTGAYLKLGPAASDSDTTSYRNSGGYILTGPEYLTVFAGTNGAELATVNFDVPRGTVSSWGDDYGNRVDRFLASAAFVSDTGSASATSGRPVMLMARGYYTRATITAYTYRNGTLAKLWTADSNANTAYAGQGAHSMMVADVDGDLARESSTALPQSRAMALDFARRTMVTATRCTWGIWCHRARDSKCSCPTRTAVSRLGIFVMPRLAPSFTLAPLPGRTPDAALRMTSLPPTQARKCGRIVRADCSLRQRRPTSVPSRDR
ncbi:MAG: hypothetical protein QM784_04850 [Polyangiaceae bacterium]